MADDLPSDERWILRELLTTLEQNGELDQVCQGIATLTRRLVPCSLAVIFLEDQGRMVPLATCPPGPVEALRERAELVGNDPLVTQAHSGMKPAFRKSSDPTLFPDHKSAAAFPMERSERRIAERRRSPREGEERRQGDRAQGVLYLGDLQARDWSADDRQRLTWLAAYASGAITSAERSQERADLAEQSQTSARLLRGWVESLEQLVEGLAALRAVKPAALLEQVAPTLQRLTGYDLAGLWLSEDGWHWSGKTPSPEYVTEAQGLLRTERPVVLDDLSGTRFRALAQRHRCLMVVPMRPYGALLLAHPQAGVWDRVQIQLVRWVSSFLAAALENGAQLRELQVAYQKLQESEAQLVHSARLAGIGQLSAGLAHEINNPLGSILLTLRTVQKLGATQAELTAPMVDNALKATQRAQEIIGKLLRFSRSDTGPQTLIDLRDIATDAVQLLRRQLEMDGVRLDYEPLEAALPVRGAAGDLQSVVMNLLLNARDAFNGEKGWIRVELSRDDGFARLRVTDSGPGVPEELAQRIFEPFFTTKEVGKGTGLGLAISRRTAVDHGGELELSRAPEGGASFCLRLPVAN